MSHLVPFSIVDVKTGKIRQTSADLPARFPLYADANSKVIEGSFDQTRHSFDPKRGFALIAEDPRTPPVTGDDVRGEAARRLARTDWMIIRAADPTSGTPVPDAVLAERAAIRAACDALLMNPISADFRDNRHWRT